MKFVTIIFPLAIAVNCDQFPSTPAPSRLPPETSSDQVSQISLMRQSISYVCILTPKNSGLGFWARSLAREASWCGEDGVFEYHSLETGCLKFSI